MVERGYWASRRSLHYYEVVRGLLDGLTKRAPLEALLDVGTADTPVPTWGHFRARYSLDPAHSQARVRALHEAGVNAFAASVADWKPKRRFDVITCLQVLEHFEVPEASAAAKKLLSVTNRLVVSVPHNWPANANTSNGHKLDPIGVLKLCNIVEAEPTWLRVTRCKRLVCMFGETV